MKGTVTITDENRILIILGGDWRTPQQIMRCLKNAGPDVAQGATIHLTTTDGKQPSAKGPQRGHKVLWRAGMSMQAWACNILIVGQEGRTSLLEVC